MTTLVEIAESLNTEVKNRLGDLESLLLAVQKENEILRKEIADLRSELFKVHE